tara:strand:+ start:1655 stop:2014 length:360 start_codon:yes stop_codon:yes gene_type:complete
MSPQTIVTIHPYFKPHEGMWDAFIGNLQAFVEKTRSEEGVLFYDFTICDDTVFCREAYSGASGALAHLDNVGSLLEEALKISDLVRLEVHGAAAELDQMREPLKDLPIQWFVLETGLAK